MQQPVQHFEQSTDLYQRYAPAVFAHLLRHLGSREDAEDLLLDVFLAVLEKEAILALDEMKQHALIWAVAHNKVADYYRRSARRTSIPLSEKEETTIYEREEHEPEQVALRREEYAQLYNTMQHLSEIQREVLHLRFGHNLSCSEIGQVVSKSEVAVRTILHRSLKLLRRLYAEDQSERKL